MSLPFNPIPKPKHKRNKPTAKQRGRISPEVYKLALRRSGGRCELCGRPGNPAYGTLQCAHLIRRWKLPKTTENDVAMLCGPSVNSGTCHHWVDYTREGKKWAEEYRDKLWNRVKEVNI